MAMPVDEIVVAAATGRAVAGFFEAGSLVRVEFAAVASDRRVGEIVLGRVRRSEAGLKATFVDIGERRSGFINRADEARGRRSCTEGEGILVQISREAEGGKLAKLTGSVVLPGRTLIYCPYRRGVRLSRRIRDDGQRKRLLDISPDLPLAGSGWFMRLGATAAEAAAIAAEAHELLATWRRIEELAKTHDAPARLWRPPDPVLSAVADEAGPGLKRIIADDPGILAAIRAYLPDLDAERRLVSGNEAAPAVRAIEAGIDAMLVADVALAGGGVIHVAETPALVAIDVDAGSHRGGGGAETALAVNLEAAVAIGLEIRRRELSGHIVIDFVAMRSRMHRDGLIDALRSAFAGDRLETHVAGYTRLGKVELTRRRARPSLRAKLCVPCPACAGSGGAPAPEATAYRGLRTALLELPGCAAGGATIVAGPGVVAALRGPAADALATVEARLGRGLRVREDPSAAVDAFRFELAACSGRSQ
ncbi:MAG: ribonuclease E/G [Rhodospirillales bacterium]